MNVEGQLSSVSFAKVLVVDDNESNTKFLELLLMKAGLHDVVTTNDSRRVSDLLVTIRPDLVMLDLNMPYIDGFKLLDIISAYASSQFLPVIIMTADTTPEALHRAFDLGAHDYLTKPLDGVEVALRTRNHLRMRFAYQELHDGNQELRERLKAVRVETLEASNLRRSRIENVIRSPDPSIVFQPIVDLLTGVCKGYEALSRFATLPRRSPDLWYDEAHSVGLGLELELKSTKLALGSLKDLPEGSFLSINVSPMAIMGHFADTFFSEIDWSRIVFEITEHTVISDYSSLERALAPFRVVGAKIAADDAGAGYASMRHIIELGPEIVKLDISITRAINTDSRRRALASALAVFANHIDAELVAEGIETESELDVMREIGVRYGQGFLLGRPGPLVAS